MRKVTLLELYLPGMLATLCWKSQTVRFLANSVRSVSCKAEMELNSQAKSTDKYYMRNLEALQHIHTDRIKIIKQCSWEAVTSPDTVSIWNFRWNCALFENNSSPPKGIFISTRQTQIINTVFYLSHLLCWKILLRRKQKLYLLGYA